MNTPADKPDLPALKRSIQTWARCDPAAMADQSQAAIYFAFQDLLSDVQTLARALADERRKALEEAAQACACTMLMNIDSYCGATAHSCADRIRRLIDKE